MTTETIKLTVVSSAFTEIEVDRARYEQATRDGELDRYLDHRLSNIEADDMVFEPDGAHYRPFDDPEGPDAAETLPKPYGHDGRYVLRRDAGGYAPIGVMADEDFASHVAEALNARAGAR